MIEQVKGTRNLFGAESEKYIHIFNAFCDAFVDYGYELVELPILQKLLQNKCMNLKIRVIDHLY